MKSDTDKADTVRELNQLLKAGAAMHLHGHHDSAEIILQHALGLCERNAQTIRFRILILNQLGLVRKLKAELSQAETTLREALQDAEEFLDQNNILLGTTIHNLAVILKARGKFLAALRCAQRSLVICKTNFGPSHTELIPGLINCAILFQQNGFTQEALHTAEDCFAVAQSDRGCITDRALACYTMSYVLKHSESVSAFHYSERALALAKEAFRRNHTDYAMLLSNHGQILLRLNRVNCAIKCHSNALAIYKTELVHHHPAIADELFFLGQIYYIENSVLLAVALLSQSVRIRQLVLGSDHPDTCDAVEILGRVAP